MTHCKVVGLALLFALSQVSGSSFAHDPQKQFEEDGFVHPIRIASSEEMDKLRKYLDQIEQEEFGGRFEGQTMNLHFKHETFWKFIQEKTAQISKTVSQIFALPVENLRIMSTQVFVKYPAMPGSIPKGTVGWHQDLTYWNLFPAEAITSWIAVDEVTDQNGCVLMLPKLHSSGKLEHRIQNSTADNVLMNKQAIPDELLVGEPVCIQLEPGEMSIHGGWTPHTSGPNKSPDRRLGLVIQWIPHHVHVGSYMYNSTENPEWRLPVDPTDTKFPPEVVEPAIMPNALHRTSEL